MANQAMQAIAYSRPLRGRLSQRLIAAVRRQVMRGWSVVGIVAEGEPIEIGGQNFWESEWARTGEPNVLLPHPQYQHQTHSFTVYEVRRGDNKQRVALAEVSANVYAFYVPS